MPSGENEGGRCTLMQSLIKVCGGQRLARYGEAATDAIGLGGGGCSFALFRGLGLR